MTNSIHRKNLVLGIALTSRGIGFAVLEDGQTLVNWGVKSVGGNKNGDALKRVRKIIAHYNPGMLVLHDATAKHFRRGPRVRQLTKKIVAMAGRRKLKVTLFSRDQVMQAFFIDGKGSKYTIAKVLAMRFPEELGHRLPRKRKDWEGEDARMSIFDAVALTLAEKLRKKSAVQPPPNRKDLDYYHLR